MFNSIRALAQRVNRRERPVDFLLGLAMIVAGVSVALTGGGASSLGATLGAGWAHTWGVMLALGGIGVVWGFVDQDAARSVAFQISGKMLAGTTELVYSVAILLNTGWNSGMVTVPFTAAVGVAFIWRSLQLWNVWRKEVVRHDVLARKD